MAAPPSTMRALVWRGDHDPCKQRIEVLRTPKPKANEVLIKVKACGVCHTDLHCIKGEVPFPQPAVFGHEISGEVVEYGPLDGAGSQHPLPVGTKVCSTFIMPCGKCAFCKKGEEDTCETFFALNRLKGHLYDDSTRLITAEGGEEVAMYSFAGLAEYAVVPTTAVFAVPDSLLSAGLYEECSILGCAFFTAFGAIRNAAGLTVRACCPGANGAAKRRKTEGGRGGSSGVDSDGPECEVAPPAPPSVCVIGCGGVGGSLLQLLKYLGCSPIIAVDVTDEALEQARALGADLLVKSSAECDAVQQISQLTVRRAAPRTAGGEQGACLAGRRLTRPGPPCVCVCVCRRAARREGRPVLRGDRPQEDLRAGGDGGARRRQGVLHRHLGRQDAGGGADHAHRAPAHLAGRQLRRAR